MSGVRPPTWPKTAGWANFAAASNASIEGGDRPNPLGAYDRCKHQGPGHPSPLTEAGRSRIAR
jgi:hypothetical protein